MINFAIPAMSFQMGHVQALWTVWIFCGLVWSAVGVVLLFRSVFGGK